MRERTGQDRSCEVCPAGRVSWVFIGLYALSYPGGSLLFLAPLLASLALKVNDSPLGDAQAVDARGPGCGAV